MKQELSELTQRLTDTFGDRLVSAILYGSAAMGDWNEAKLGSERAMRTQPSFAARNSPSLNRCFTGGVKKAIPRPCC